MSDSDTAIEWIDADGHPCKLITQRLGVPEHTWYDATPADLRGAGYTPNAECANPPPALASEPVQGEEVGTAEYWHKRFSTALTTLEEYQAKNAALEAEREALTCAVDAAVLCLGKLRAFGLHHLSAYKLATQEALDILSHALRTEQAAGKEASPPGAPAQGETWGMCGHEQDGLRCTLRAGHVGKHNAYVHAAPSPAKPDLPGGDYVSRELDMAGKAFDRDRSWPKSCGECRYSAREPYCALFDMRLSRDVVGLRVRLPVCLEAERRSQPEKGGK